MKTDSFPIVTTALFDGSNDATIFDVPRPPGNAEYARFSDWLIRRGRTEETASNYVGCLRLCFADDRGPLARVSLDELSPNTRRTNKAALMAWADFKGKEKMRRHLQGIKLPPASRVTDKRAMEFEQWAAVLDALETVRNEPVRAVLMLICHRGFRITDVCRMTRPMVKNAVDTGTLVYKAKGRRMQSWTVTVACRGALETLLKQRRWAKVWDLVSPQSSPEKRHRAAAKRIQRAFGKLLDRAAIDGGFSPHSMRRTYAWHFLAECRAQGRQHPVLELQKHMDWANIQTAFQYVDQSEREELDALADSMATRLHFTGRARRSRA